VRREGADLEAGRGTTDEEDTQGGREEEKEEEEEEAPLLSADSDSSSTGSQIGTEEGNGGRDTFGDGSRMHG